jgi:hypothetical protein
LTKEELLERLTPIVEFDRTIKIPLKILFDKEIWKNGVVDRVKIFEGTISGLEDIESTTPPNILFKKLRSEYLNKPYEYYAIRTELIEAIKNSEQTIFNQTDLRKLWNYKFQNKANNLTEFHKLGSEDDFFNKMNKWYYGALGTRAFTIYGGVPDSISIDDTIQKMNARFFYSKIKENKGQKNGEQIETYIAEKVGFGGKVNPVIAFLEELVRLTNKGNKKNGNIELENTKYIASDISQRCIIDAKIEYEDLKKHNYLPSISETESNKKKSETELKNIAEFYNTCANIVDFKISDLKKNKIKRKEKPFCQESSYLLDSISQPVIAKIGGKFYELKYRAYLDTKKYYNFNWANGYRMSAREFQHMLIHENIEKLSKVHARTFDNIEWEISKHKINMSKYPNGRIIEELCYNVDNVTLPTGETHIKIIEDSLKNIQNGGYIQIFDLGIKSSDDLMRMSDHDMYYSGGILRYNGAVYMPLNLYVIEKVLSEKGIKIRVEDITDYLSKMSNHTILDTVSLKHIASDPALFEKIYPIEYMHKYDLIIKTSQEIMKSKGYSMRGKVEFYRQLQEQNLLEWADSLNARSEIFFDKSKDYVSNMRNTLRLKIMNRGFEKCGLWLSNSKDSKNNKILDELNMYGFETRITQHLFEQREILKKYTNYHHILIEK